jgi:putative DNA primase/helicase
VSTTKRGPCPVCNKGPKDTAMSTKTDELGTVSHCKRCGYVTYELRERTSAVRLRLQDAPRTVNAPPLEWSPRAECIWRKTLPLGKSLGAHYLLYRGCLLPPEDSDLRFLPASGEFPPTLCSRVTDSLTAKPLSLHFTRLASDGRGKAGTDCDKLLLKGHRKSRGCIRLWPDEAVTCGLAIAEGIETALAAAHMFVPAWATVDAGNMSTFPLLPGIESLTIYADHDEAGLKAARECARRWRDAGRLPRILTPVIAGQDAADLVCA